MKKLSIALISIMLLTLAGSALAAKPGSKDPKIIRHCGCVFDYTLDSGTEMLYHDIETSGNSKGHKNHDLGTFSDCWVGTYTEVETVFIPDTELWIRSGNDCEVTDMDPNIDNVTC